MVRQKIQSARAKSNGIVFYSPTDPYMGVSTTLGPYGEIDAQATVTPVEDAVDFYGGGLLKGYHVRLAFIIVLDLILIAIAIPTLNPWIIAGIIYFAVFASGSFYQVFVYFAGTKFLGLRSLGRFLSAEHMAVSTYNELRRVPTLEEIKKSSRVSENYGARKLLEKAFCYTVISLELIVFGVINPFLYFFALAATIAVFAQLQKNNGFLFLQYLITNKPRDIELLVAIAGLRELERLEDAMESDRVSDLKFRCTAFEY